MGCWQYIRQYSDIIFIANDVLIIITLPQFSRKRHPAVLFHITHIFIGGHRFKPLDNIADIRTFGLIRSIVFIRGCCRGEPLCSPLARIIYPIIALTIIYIAMMIMHIMTAIVHITRADTQVRPYIVFSLISEFSILPDI